MELRPHGVAVRSYASDAQLQPAAAVWWNGTGRDRGGAIRFRTSRSRATQPPRRITERDPGDLAARLAHVLRDAGPLVAEAEELDHLGDVLVAADLP